MGLLNYTTGVPAEKTVGQIIAILAKNGATAILMDYDDLKTISAISFRVDTPHGNLPFSLPINVEAVAAVLAKQHRQGRLDARAIKDGQAARVGWRILKDWVEAQMALLETEMVSLDQVFLPYLRTGRDETLYQRMLRGGFKELTAPRQDEAP